MATIYGTKYNDNNTSIGSWPYTYYPELKGTNDDDVIFGYHGNDILRGYGGSEVGYDYLDGGPGADTMYGGSGDDRYIVDNVNDQVIEYSTDPLTDLDEVSSSVDYTLPSYFEMLVLSGTAHVGSGNGSYNWIFGNDTYNTLRGFGGNDKIYGNGGNDYINGGGGNDTIEGGKGNDGLQGGGIGNDLFVFQIDSGTDRIDNFNASEDTIGLEFYSSNYQGLIFDNGTLSTSSYFEGSLEFNGTVNGPSGIYVDVPTGHIWYNPTSSQTGDSYHFATADPASIIGGVSSLSATDFVYA